jgi:hypothetical protein
MHAETNPTGPAITHMSATETTPAEPRPGQTNASAYAPSELEFPTTEPWPEPVTGKVLLDQLEQLVRRFVILPGSAPAALALWIVHTYAFGLRDVSTYLGIESPEPRCGKTTLLTVLLELVHRPIVAANISSPAFFRLIAETRPTLLIDEADTLLQGNDELRGILNSGYTRRTAFVVRVANSGLATPLPAHQPSTLNPQSSGSKLARFSSWCPKAMAAIGHLPATLADRCILILMQRKGPGEHCEKLRNLHGTTLRRQCARFVLDHAQSISNARPVLPPGLNDRAEDIWEPLLILADLAGGDWPQKARQAALHLSAGAAQSGPMVALLVDILRILATVKDDRLPSRLLVAALNSLMERRWLELTKGKPMTEMKLAHQLRPYGIQPRTIRLGTLVSKGYVLEDFTDTLDRYVPRADFEAMAADVARNEPAGFESLFSPIDSPADGHPNGTTPPAQPAPKGPRR